MKEITPFAESFFTFKLIVEIISNGKMTGRKTAHHVTLTNHTLTVEADNNVEYVCEERKNEESINHKDTKIYKLIG